MSAHRPASPRVLLARPKTPESSETFLLAHEHYLPDAGTVLCGVAENGDISDGRRAVLLDGRPVPGQFRSPGLAGLPRRIGSRLARRLSRGGLGSGELAGQFPRARLRALRESRPDVVLAEYGPHAVGWVDPCRAAGVPLVPHFHGYDATRRDVLERHREVYAEMFRVVPAVVAVSRHMRERLATAGCATQKIAVVPCGCESELFPAADASSAPPTLLAVGRFVDKKAPHLTLLAFAQTLVHPDVPAGARLVMIGDGPLLAACRDLAIGLGVVNQVEFLGALPHAEVAGWMRAARAFVQHSVEAEDGDCEGTPVAVLEAGAAGLPVVATRHAGIPDVVIDGETGLLCDERDVTGMATSMVRLLADPAAAGRLGSGAAARVRAHFDRVASLDRLASVLRAAADGTTVPYTDPDFLRTGPAAEPSDESAPGLLGVVL
ncbi:glycosyltransferase [Alienimonas californiensis]|uniref:GDP-mannose-dependent alpha-(1-6)-phosphatidylinositol monomannoside mannosyltransferase n=1 Tax=Alienimonas californiensis TaxID=2527989 RepID=A0A517P4A6_9PLAN|nr:glycosyltransferase [Alienimonas californiensis]QDT14183.1 GDP-mannose-dependent alpha-(1-6)-phosphatidylinositol monomannoside mannosyltransferase [Alienimonas californiensis]